MSIEIKNYEILKKDIEGKAKLLVVSKKQTREDIIAYYNLGERAFAENRSQELLSKIDLYDDIEWHFIGHLQRNKVKDVIPHIQVLESLDSLELARVIEDYCIKHEKGVRALVEIHLAENDFRKTGIKKEDVYAFFESCKNFKHIQIEGIMVMGPHFESEENIRNIFKEAHSIFVNLQEKYGKDKIKTLSMGMTHDYKIAIEEGSTEVRIGTFLFTPKEEVQ